MASASSDGQLARLHDVELAQLAAAGGRREFGELVRRHSGVIRGLLRRMGADPATADDLAQDTFLQAFERIAEFRGDGAFVGWLRRIAARLYLRRRRREAALTLSADPEGSFVAEPEIDSASRIDLDEALKTLTPPERLCVSLCYGGGLSHVEVAEALHAPLGTVKSHVRRGLDKLRARMAPQDDERRGSQAHG